MRPRTTIIGIAGASGSGKTTASKILLDHYGEQHCTIISADNYYKDLSHLSLEQRAETNFDHPDSIDFTLLAEQLGMLKRGLPVSIPTYDFSIHSRKHHETIHITPKKMIIIEGILVLHPEEVLNQIDMKIFVKANLELCKERRIKRDIMERGRTREQVLTQMEKTVMPMYQEYVAPTESLADFIFGNDSTDFTIDKANLIERVEALIESPSQSGTSIFAGNITMYPAQRLVPVPEIVISPGALPQITPLKNS